MGFDLVAVVVWVWLLLFVLWFAGFVGFDVGAFPDLAVGLRCSELLVIVVFEWVVVFVIDGVFCGVVWVAGTWFGFFGGLVVCWLGGGLG